MERIESVDVFRTLAIIAVIAIHTKPFAINLPESNELYNWLHIIVSQVTPFAVPFFFVIAGYFWGIKARDSNPLRLANSMGKRIAVIYAAWCLIYLLPYNLSTFSEYGAIGPIKAAYLALAAVVESPSLLIFEGTKIHLWFLSGLLFALYIAAAFIHKGKIKTLVVLAVALYVVGIGAKAYAHTPLGVDIAFDTRNGPFMSLVFFVSGYMLSAYKPSEGWLKYGALMAGGIASLV